MPITVVASKPRGVEADDQPGVSKPDLCDEFLEALSLDAARAGFAEIFIDDVHAFMWPAKSDGTIDETILQLRVRGAKKLAPTSGLAILMSSLLVFQAALSDRYDCARKLLTFHSAGGPTAFSFHTKRETFREGTILIENNAALARRGNCFSEALQLTIACFTKFRPRISVSRVHGFQ